MAVKNKFIHFNTRSGFNSQVPNPELNSENGNEFYNYIVFIKESKEIYTHGQFYDCSKYDDTEILQLVNSISDRFDTFESNLNDLTSEVEDNELVAAKALTDLNNKIEELLNSSTGSSYPQINHGTNDTTLVLTPNTMHVWGVVDSLDLTLGESIEGVLNEYIFIFETGSEPAELILPDSLKFESDSNLSIKSFKKYVVSIVNELIEINEFGDNINNNITFERYGTSNKRVVANSNFPVKSNIYLYIGSAVVNLVQGLNYTGQITINPGSYPLGLSFDPNDICPKTEIEDDTYKYIVPKYLSITED